MSEDDDGYGDEFYDNEFQSQSFRERKDEVRDDGDDEQHAQKMNGKLEALQQRADELEQELTQERQLGLDIRKQYEKELQLAWKQQSKAEEKSVNSAREESSSQVELERYKKKCVALEQKLEMAFLTNTATVERVPAKIEEAIHDLCVTSKFLPELQDKTTLSTDECLTILHAFDKKKKKATSEAAEGRGVITTTRLNERIRLLEGELRIASNTADDAEQLKAKVFQATERIRMEKEQKRTLEIELTHAKKKVEMLSDHVEKLVVHVKREAAHKVRLAEQLRFVEKESVKSKERSDLVQKKSAAKDRLVLELREGAKVLEDQLRLMDEKYLELRGKLDYARSISAKKIKKAERVAADLRVKFAMTGSPIVLDNISIPSGYAGMSESGGGSGGGGGMGMFSSEGMPPEFAALFRSSESVQYPPKKGAGSQSVMSNKSHNINGNASVASYISQRPEPTLDGVLGKIRHQTGSRQEWTDEKIQALTKSR